MNIREATPGDYDELVRFWNNNSGWDEISRETWEERFIRAPYGPSVVILGEKDGRIMAKLVFIRLKVSLGNMTVSGCRPFAAVVDKSLQGLSGYKYIIQIFNYGTKIMRDKGFDLLIMMPDPRWKAIARFVDLLTYNFPLFKRSIGNEFEMNIQDSCQVKSIDFDHPGIESLWEEVRAQDLYMIIREKEILKWKNSHHDYKIAGIFKHEKLIGIATYLEKAQENQIQICDVLYSDNSLKKQVLSHISDFINRTYMTDSRFKKMVILVTESLKNSLEEIGYFPDDYQFLFGIKRLNKNLTKKALNISHWYFSAND
jgi:hypothetical protein